MFFVIEADGWQIIKPPDVPYGGTPLQYPEFNCYDQYGMSLVAILVDVMTNNLLHSTSRWNHIILPKSGAADSMFESWQQLNKATGIDVEKACYGECAKFRVELEAKADAANAKAAKALKNAKIITDVTIPRRIKQYITKVVVPNGVESIGEYAFHECKSLDSIDIPSSVKSIGDFAFEWCTGLKSVKIPSHVESIGKYAFSACNSLEQIEIPDSVEYIGSWAFDQCDSLERVKIPAGVTSISNGMFSTCKSLKNIELPDSVESIGDDAFTYCESIQSITVPGRVRRIGEDAFYSCKSLKEVVFTGKTLEQVRAMDNYPWGIEDESVIVAK